MRYAAFCITFLVSLGASAHVAQAQAVPAASATRAGALLTETDQPAIYDVFSNVLSEPQRKLLDRDSRCSDARTKTDTFANSEGKELQTGVDAMAALEKCATLNRIGGDWTDYRDYVITAAAAIAYRVGVSAKERVLLQRAIGDASHVSGYDASAATVASYARTSTSIIPNTPGDNSGHKMGEGPAQATLGNVRDTRRVSADNGSYGAIATKISSAAAATLAALPAAPK